MAKEKDKSKEQKSLEATLWDAANKLIGSTMPHNYMNICLGLIFLKYVSDRFELRYNELKAEGDGFEEEKDEYARKNIFWVPENSRWSFVSKHSKKEEIGKILDEALLAIEKENKELAGILPKVYSGGDIEKRTLGELVDLLSNQLATEKLDGDVFGKCYEYFLGAFNKKFGQKGGEFYTPSSIVELLVRMLKPHDGRVYDPACGSGGMFSHSIDFIKSHQGNINKISIYGQERNPDTWRLAKMNLAIRGISADLGNSFGDTFHDDKHKLLRADFILANPPFNIKDYGQPQLLEDPRWIYGTPPSGNANYAWLQHMFSKLSQKGSAGIVLANGSLSSNQKEEYAIRKAMLERDGGIVDCIVSLPSNLFSTVTIPACLWFLSNNRENRKGKVLFIDAKKAGVMIDRKIRELTEDDLVLITKTYEAWKSGEGYEDVKGFCKSASLEDIAKIDYSLVPGRYVGIDDSNKKTKEEVEEEIKKVKAELLELMQESKKLDEKVFAILRYGE